MPKALRIKEQTAIALRVRGVVNPKIPPPLRKKNARVRSWMSRTLQSYVSIAAQGETHSARMKKKKGPRLYDVTYINRTLQKCP